MRFSIKKIFMNSLRKKKINLLQWLSLRQKEIFLLFLLQICLSSCTSLLYSDFRINIKTGNNLNPNVYEQAAPLVITLLQLSSLEELNRASYRELLTNSHEFLNHTLLNMDEIELQPNSVQQIKINMNSKTKYLAILGDFRNMNELQPLVFRQIKPNLKELELYIDKLNINFRE